MCGLQCLYVLQMIATDLRVSGHEFGACRCLYVVKFIVLKSQNLKQSSSAKKKKTIPVLTTHSPSSLTRVHTLASSNE